MYCVIDHDRNWILKEQGKNPSERVTFRLIKKKRGELKNKRVLHEKDLRCKRSEQVSENERCSVKLENSK